MSLIANACWPSRFLTKWLAVFFGAVAFGMLLAVVFHPRTASDVKARVSVRVFYNDLTGGEPVRAQIYLDAKNAGEIKPNDSFLVDASGSAKRLAPGLRDFMVQPLDKNNKPAGAPVHLQVRWPRTALAPVAFVVRRDYAKQGRAVTPGPPKPTPNINNPPPPSGDDFAWLSERAVTDGDLAGKTHAELRLLRNTIFARHGHVFSDADLRAHFARQRWYRPRKPETPATGLETANAQKIKQAEESR